MAEKIPRSACFQRGLSIGAAKTRLVMAAALAKTKRRRGQVQDLLITARDHLAHIEMSKASVNLYDRIQNAIGAFKKGGSGNGKTIRPLVDAAERIESNFRNSCAKADR